MPKNPDNLWKHPKSGIWYVRIMKDGTRKAFSTKTTRITEARKAADKIKAEIWTNNFGFENEEKDVTFKQLTNRYLDWCETNHVSYSTDVAYVHNLLKHFNPDVYIHKISELDVERYKKARTGQVKPSTINHELKCLKHMYRLAVRWGMTTHNPTINTNFIKGETQRIRYLSDDERQQLLAACAGGPWYLLPIVQIAVNTGMRRGEILGLRWKDIDLQTNNIRIVKSKSGKPREIPMNGILRDLFRSIENSDGNIFPVVGFRKSWVAALKQAGIKDLRFHDLRHEFASQLAISGVDLYSIQQLLGHSTPRMTQRYAHLTDQHKMDAVEKLVNLQRKPVLEETEKVVRIY